MTGSPPPVVTAADGPVATVTLNRPGAGNSLSMALIEALGEAMAGLASREDIKVVIVSGAGGRIFSAGHDLGEFNAQPGEDWFARDFAKVTALMQAIVAQPQIVIAKVEGVATAAGLEIVASCDLALASSTARFGVPGVNIGFWCHTPQVALSRTVARKDAMLMLATGQLYPADHALRIGLVNAVHPPEELDRAVDELAATIASKPASVLRRGKRSFNAQLGLDRAAAYEFARGEACGNIAHPDAVEGIAAFVEKRKPDW